MVLSRSSRNFGLVGARGPSCSVANVNAGVISPAALQDRISSTSCRRKREKCKALSSSRICVAGQKPNCSSQRLVMMVRIGIMESY